jgi:peptide/nickel transport system substrate-binding protein
LYPIQEEHHVNTTRRGAKLLAIAAASALVIAACGSDDDSGDSGSDNSTDTGSETTDESTAESTDDTTATSDGDAGEGGSGFVYGFAQEFSNYNNNLGTSNSVKNGVVLNEVQPNPFNFTGPTGGLEMDGELMDSIEVVNEDPQTIEYVVNADAVWSDGEPIDCDDFMLQYYANNGDYLQLDDSGEPVIDADTGGEVFLFDLVGTTGYDQIDTVECSEDLKTITVTYATPFADWQGSFTGQVPAHVIAREAGVEDLLGAFESDDLEAITAIAETYNTLYTVNPGEINPDTMLSGGRYSSGSWEPGASVTLVPNENYWGTPANGEVVIRIIAEEAQAQALANGELNAMDPQPSVDLIGQLDGIDGIVVENGSQYTWEHFDFNFNSEIWQDIRVREAFAKCLPRQQMVESLILPVNPEAEVLNNRWIQPFEEGYQDNSGGAFDEVDIAGAQALIAEAGVTTPTPVRLGWFNNGGNQRRADQVALTIESCNHAGFEITDTGSETFFDVELDAGDWDIAMFAWAGSPLKSGGVATYRPGEGNNVGNIDIPEIQPLMDELLVTTDPATQIDLVNQIDVLLWENLATIPVFSFPGVAAFSENAENVVYNPSQNGLTWNAGSWSLT